MNRNGRLTWNNRDDTDARKYFEALQAAFDTEKARAEKAEKERDEARARLAEAAKEIREQGETIAELAAEPSPLTADDITDEMIERGMDKFCELDVTGKEPLMHVIEQTLRAALTPEPQRPEWEQVESLLREMPPGTVTQGSKWLVERGVRVVTEEEQ